MRNMAVVHSQGWNMDWGVVVYEGPQDLSDWAPVRAVAAMLNVSLWLKRSLLKDGFHPKQTMQHHFREALGPQHEGIWLLDEDISLARTNITSWLSLWRCAFPGGHPLVAAAPIKQSTQAFWPHNWLTWTPGVDHGWLGGALGLKTSFVEGQAPLLDAKFFAWFFGKLEAGGGAGEGPPAGTPLWEALDKAGTDWGVDELWCKAGEEFLGASKGDPKRTTCAVLREPIDHEDSKTIRESSKEGKGGTYSSEWGRKGHEMRGKIAAWYPQWFSSNEGYHSAVHVLELCGAPDPGVHERPQPVHQRHVVSSASTSSST